MTGLPFRYADVRRGTKTINALERPFTALSEPVTFLLLNFTTVTPNAITLLGAAFGLLGSVLAFEGLWLAAGATYSAFFVLDCCDGAIARIRGPLSPLGAKLDLYSDRLVLTAAVIARTALHLMQASFLAAFLCVLYFLSHCIEDFRWLRIEQRKAAEPEALPALIRSLRCEGGRVRQERVMARGGWRAALYRLARIEHQLRPTAWVCNIAFLAGTSFWPRGEIAITLACTVALQYPFLIAALRPRLMRTMMASR